MTTTRRFTLLTPTAIRKRAFIDGPLGSVALFFHGLRKALG